MEDADESSSENSINVMGIRDFPESPHQVNKKAYVFSLVLEKDTPNQYRSRIGFNLHPLPVGYYTLFAEYFPPEMTKVSVTPQATTISISSQTTEEFAKYTKSLIHFHRWNSSPPQYLYLDVHGTVSDTSLVTGRLVVYGVQDTVSSVDPSVYDTGFAIEKGQMVMQTDLSLNSHRLLGLIHYIHGYLDQKKGDNKFMLNGFGKIIIPKNSRFSTVVAFYHNSKTSYQPIALKITNYSFEKVGTPRTSIINYSPPTELNTRLRIRECWRWNCRKPLHLRFCILLATVEITWRKASKTRRDRTNAA